MKASAVINAVKHERWCQVLTMLMRLTVGAVFVFSGFTKAIDPWGSCYKITDYLNAMGLSGWSDTALFAAVAIAAVEFVLGIVIVVGAYRRSAPWVALLVMLVMTPLTLWLAVSGAVPDCGCFGDAVHLSNWATFGKNVLLLLGIIYLLLFNKSLRGIYGPAVQWVVVALSFLMVMAVAYYGYFVQPLIDYRPYPVGTRLASATVEDDDEASEDDFIFIYSKNGEQHEFTIDSLPDEEEGWEYVTRYHSRRPHGRVIVQNGNASPSIAIMDTEGNDVTLDVLADSRRTVLLLFPDLPHVSMVNSFALNELNDAALVAQADVVGLTPATSEEIEQWQDVSMASYPIYNMDDSELKMIARGNPAVVYLEEGVIKWKRTLSSLDDVEQPVELAAMGDDVDADAILTRLMLAFLAGMAILLVINRTHLLVRYFYYKAHRKHLTDKP
ncbi:MAG: DoxX family membrane protein [Muribaculaceae bacterium]|nr:DoxX family membrane protein [Muribaculaceae bacterium]